MRALWWVQLLHDALLSLAVASLIVLVARIAETGRLDFGVF